MSYEVPEEHAGLLRTMLSIGVEDPLPESVSQAYFALRRCLDRISAGFPVEMLAVVAVTSGASELKEDSRHSQQQRDWAACAPGTEVLAGRRAGRFLAVEEVGRQGRKKTKVRVQFDEGEESLFDPETVTLPEMAGAA